MDWGKADGHGEESLVSRYSSNSFSSRPRALKLGPDTYRQPGSGLGKERRPRRQARGGPEDPGRWNKGDIQGASQFLPRPGWFSIFHGPWRRRTSLPIRIRRPSHFQAVERRAGAWRNPASGGLCGHRRPAPRARLEPAEDHGSQPGWPLSWGATGRERLPGPVVPRHGRREDLRHPGRDVQLNGVPELEQVHDDHRPQLRL